MIKYKALFSLALIPILLSGCADNSETVKKEYVTIGSDGVRSVSLESETIPLTYTPKVSKEPVLTMDVSELEKDPQWIDEVKGDGASQQKHLPDPPGTTNNFSDGNYHYFNTVSQCSLSAGLIQISGSKGVGDISLTNSAFNELGIINVENQSAIEIKSNNGTIDFVTADFKDANYSGWVAVRAINSSSGDSFPVMFVKLSCADSKTIDTVNKQDILNMISVELG